MNPSNQPAPAEGVDSIPLIGYANRLSARPGDAIEFKVSSQFTAPYQARLVRIICADPNPAGSGLLEERIESAIDGAYPSRRQPFYPGSFATATAPNLFRSGSFTLLATIWPSLPGDRQQAILSCREAAGGHGVDLFLDAEGRCGAALSAADGSLAAVSVDEPLKARRWRRVWASFDHRSGVLSVGQTALGGGCEPIRNQATVKRAPTLTGVNRVRIAAFGADPAHGHFNGKIEAPMILDGCLSARQIESHLKQMDQWRREANNNQRPDNLLAHWDFSRGIPTTRAEDIGPGHFHAKLVNLPTRAMTGSNWDGREMCWRHAAEQYGAIHFHDDDIVDFNWQTDFSLVIPRHLRSGLYAIRLQCGQAFDAIPFFVCPPKGKPAARLCVLASTFTYTVYGNHARPNFAPAWGERIKAWQAYPWNPAEHRGYGLSTYNFHRDGSGICHASHHRPLMTMRPGFLTFGDGAGECSGLRHLQADSHLLAWLQQNGINYDIITDQELHDQGVAAIADYPAVTTGSHPEYHTVETMNALQAYRDGGGNFMYLGGNGFYWKVALHQSENGAIEIRRAESGIRAWAAEPGEYYQAFDGAYGGLWRRNGRPPQALAGVGFSAQGTFVGSYYRRCPTTFTEPEIAWIFHGIDEEIIGDFGFSGGGAAGFELDRADARLGSPNNFHLLASSENHGETFVLVPEERLTHEATWSGEPPEALIRADMIYQIGDHGGQLFATGSITFCGSLLHNNGDNNISTLLLNVITRFTR